VLAECWHGRHYRAVVRFRVLGPVEVECGGEVLSLARRQERGLLGILLLEPDRLIPLDRLCDLLWEENPPEQARRAVQSHAARIRGLLARTGGAELVSRSGGYLLRVDPDTVDAHRFRALVRRSSAVDDVSARAALLREALELWRGPVLHDAASDWLREQLGAELADLRLHAIEESMEAGLALGRQHELAAELAALTAAHPTRERLVELHMRALYRAGRTPDALTAFARARALLADQLGVDPGPRLVRLHQAILRGEDIPVAGSTGPAAVSVPAGPAPGSAPTVVPRCLPRDIADFTGRDDVLGRLLAAVPSGPSATDTVSTVVAIDGMAGVGKTALAVRFAHRVADRYPGGQLAIDLHGHSEQAPMEPAAALDRLLRQLGVAGDRIPDGLDARVELWRTELAGRKVLLLLDNASTSEQIGPLLPAGVGCLTVVTSRRRLAGLDGAYSVPLEVLTPDESIALMQRIVGSRVADDPAGAGEVARRCEYLTLAVRLAAARLAHRPGWTVRDLATRLGLEEIAVEGRSVVAAFRLSYGQVGGGAQRLFRLLGLHPGPDIDIRAAASLAVLSLEEAEPVLAELVDAHLLEEPTASRYRLHDLLKEYASQLVGTLDSETERQAGVERLMDYYVHTAAAAANANETEIAISPFDYRLGTPPPLALQNQDADSAESWLSAERSNLVAAVWMALEIGRFDHAWRLARAAWRHLYRNGFHDEIIAMMSQVGTVAKRTDDRPAIGLAHNFVAGSCFARGRWDEALANLDTAIVVRTELGDSAGLQSSLANYALVLINTGRFTEARYFLERAIRTIAPMQTAGVAALHLELGVADMWLGDFDRANQNFQHYLSTGQGSKVALSLGYSHLGAMALRQARYQEAHAFLQKSQEIGVDLDPWIIAERTCDLGSALRGLGDLEQALACQRRALWMSTVSVYPFGECDARIELATTLRQAGQSDEAMTHATIALEVANRLALRHQSARALHTLALIKGDDDLRAQAEALFDELGLPRPVPAPTLEQ
jgi:DNA-binding SARP family transcriptional activator/tetratricopeptide (TPR) repeat protein